MTLALLWQGEAALTEVVCLFTEGVVMNIAPFGMAAVTVVTALCCCQRKGLPRCVWLLRYPLLVLLALLFFELTWNGHWDYLLPLSGAGNAANRTLFLDMTAMGWPLILFAELPAREKGAAPGHRGRSRRCFCCACCWGRLPFPCPRNWRSRGKIWRMPCCCPWCS